MLYSNNESRGAGADEKQGIYFAWPNGQSVFSSVDSS